MKNDALTKEQVEILDREGAALREMMKSEGWKVASKLFHSTLVRYDSTQGILTMKALLGRQDAIRMLNDWMEAIVQRVSRLTHNEAVRREVKERIGRSGIVTVDDAGEDEEP